MWVTVHLKRVLKHIQMKGVASHATSGIIGMEAELASVWPDLSRPQIKMLAEYSLRMILAESSGLTGTLFRSADAQLNCTLVGCWAKQCAEPWLIATDLPADQAKATWYGLRNWIERGFKHDKSGAMRWQNTRMTDPDRASVLWLVMALARLLSMLGGAHHFAVTSGSDASSPRHPLMTGLVPLDANLTPAPWPAATPTHLSQTNPIPP